MSNKPSCSKMPDIQVDIANKKSRKQPLQKNRKKPQICRSNIDTDPDDDIEILSDNNSDTKADKDESKNNDSVNQSANTIETFQMPLYDMDFEYYEMVMQEPLEKELQLTNPTVNAARHLRSCFDHHYIQQFNALCPRSLISENNSARGKQLSIAILKNDGKMDYLHMHWCGVCGKTKEKLEKCAFCCVSFHVSCAVEETSLKENELMEMKKCHKCINDSALVTGDIVWHKLKRFPWWPAKILRMERCPRELGIPPSFDHVPVCYYKCNNYAWALRKELCHFAINYDILKKSLYKNHQSAIQLAKTAAQNGWSLE